MGWGGEAEQSIRGESNEKGRGRIKKGVLPKVKGKNKAEEKIQEVLLMLEIFKGYYILVSESRHVEPSVFRIALKVPCVPRVGNTRDDGGLGGGGGGGRDHMIVLRATVCMSFLNSMFYGDGM